MIDWENFTVVTGNYFYGRNKTHTFIICEASESGYEAYLIDVCGFRSQINPDTLKLGGGLSGKDWVESVDLAKKVCERFEKVMCMI